MTPKQHKLQKIIVLILVFILLLAIILLYRVLPTLLGNDISIDDTPTPLIANTTTPANTPVPPIELAYGDLLANGLDPEQIALLDKYIAEQVDLGFPGATLMISKDNNIIYEKSYGYSVKYNGMDTLVSPEIMDTDTLFDIASLTKIYATTLSIMKLYEDGSIDIDAPVYEYLPNYIGGGKEQVTVRMLLTHSAGYTQTHKHYLEVDDLQQDNPYYSRDRELTKQIIQTVPLDEAPSTTSKYSDTNYMLLMCIIEAVSNMTIDEYAMVNFYKPLGIDNYITYNPLDNGISSDTIAATERCGNTRDYLVDFTGIRTYTLRGEVHDENCYYSFGSVSGHAGLFSNTYALTVINNMLLNGGTIDNRIVLKPETIATFMTIYDDSRYQLGFWNAKSYSRFEGYVSERAFYHTGWTGCISLIDYNENLSIILLTNKRHCPIINDSFQTDEYEISRYYGVIQRIYDAIG